MSSPMESNENPEPYVSQSPKTVEKDEAGDKPETDKTSKKEESDDKNKNTEDSDKKEKDSENADQKKKDTKDGDSKKKDTDEDKPKNEDGASGDDGNPPVDEESPSPSIADPNEEEDPEECKEGETCPQYIKSINEQYIDYRETAKTMIYLIDCRDRAKIFKWICKLDSMDDEEGQLERLLYIKYLVQTLSEPYGLVDPFTSYPPDRIKPLRNILAPVVFADLLEEQADKCFEKRRPEPPKKEDPSFGPVQDDKKFYNQQLFPPEGLICYAVAFSTT